MTLKINGTTISTQPSEHGWVSRNPLGVNGLGHSIYPATREYELLWDIIDATTYNQLQAFYTACDPTGTVVVTLPQFANSSYTSVDYSGCILREPQYGGYFEQHYQDVILLIVNVRT